MIISEKVRCYFNWNNPKKQFGLEDNPNLNSKNELIDDPMLKVCSSKKEIPNTIRSFGKKEVIICVMALN
jgi:hypothetical protein